MCIFAIRLSFSFNGVRDRTLWICVYFAISGCVAYTTYATCNLSTNLLYILQGTDDAFHFHTLYCEHWYPKIYPFVVLTFKIEYPLLPLGR